MRRVVLAACVTALAAPVLWAARPGVTFSHDVAPILYRHCVACHHPGAGAPFSLLSYPDAARRAALIAAVTANRSMPPWLPDAPQLAGERRLSEAEISVLGRWARAATDGMPAEGHPSEMPPEPRFPEGWALGPPGLETEMPAPFLVPADGPDLYRCFAIPLPNHPQRYIKAIEIQPGNPKVVHHALLFQEVAGPAGSAAQKRDSGSGYDCFGTPGFLPARGLGGWTPGTGAVDW